MQPANATHLACECLGGYTGIDCADNRCPNDCFSGGFLCFVATFECFEFGKWIGKGNSGRPLR